MILCRINCYATATNNAFEELRTCESVTIMLKNDFVIKIQGSILNIKNV